MKKLDITQKTKAYTYMMPLLGIKLEPFKENIVNAFFGDEDYPEYNNHIFILYKFSGTTEFLKFEDNLENEEPLMVKSYDPDREYVMKVFKILKRFEDDYKLLKESKYSQISMELKTRIIAFHNLPQEHPIIDVIFKREAAFQRLENDLNKYDNVSKITVDRNLEASGLLDFSREIYNSNYKKGNIFKNSEEQFLEEGVD